MKHSAGGPIGPPACLYSYISPEGAAALKKARSRVLFSWRRHPDLNRGSGICSPVPYHLAMAPYMGFADGSVRKSFLCGAAYEARTRYLHLGKVALYRMS